MRNNQLIRRLNNGLAGVLLIIAMLGYAPGVEAQIYPKRPIQLHVAHDADGNAPNQIAAAMQQTLSRSLGVNVVIATSKNRAGKTAAQIIGSAAGAGGYQVMLANAQSHLSAPVYAGSDDALSSSLLGVIASSPLLCVINAQSTIQTMTDLIAQVKREPKFRISSDGKFSHSHLTAQLVVRAAGVTDRLNHLGLKSPAAALAAVLKGTAQFTCVSASLALPFIERRQLRALLATSAVADLDVPTAKDAGLTGFEVLDDFMAVAASKRSKAEVVSVWQRALTQLSQDKKFADEASKLGFRVGRDHLMLRAQANAVLTKRRAALQDLLRKYGVAANRR
jgi:tripartite-type tricarboxylate transporter receptor subunit TctC